MSAGRGRSAWCVAGYAIVLIALSALVPTSASAHNVVATITPPATPPAEDAVFAISFAADVSSFPKGMGNLTTRIRSADGTPPCAPRPDDDAGVSVSLPDGGLIKGRASVSGAVTLRSSGDYVVCAWVQDGGTWGLPASAKMTVRSPVLELSASAPASARVRTPFAITVSYQAEVARHLSVVLTRAPNCSFSIRAIVAIDLDHQVVLQPTRVAGADVLALSGRVESKGRYLLCAYFDDFEDDEDHLFDHRRPAAFVAALATIAAVAAPPQPAGCGALGGPRAIRDIGARGLRCAAARAVARRWGRVLPAPRRLGSYRCAAKSGHVICRAGPRQVTFAFGRRGTRGS